MKLADAELLRFGIDEFEPWARQWRCFCGSIHVQAGTTMIATILVILLQYTILRLLFMTRDQEPIVWRLVQIFMLTIDTIVVGALLYGCRRERHHYLLPYLVYSAQSALMQMCGVALGVLAFIRVAAADGWLLALTLFESRSSATIGSDDGRAVRLAALFTITSCSISLGLTIWWASVVLRCYSYFKARQQLGPQLIERERRRPEATIYK